MNPARPHTLALCHLGFRNGSRPLNLFPAGFQAITPGSAQAGVARHRFLEVGLSKRLLNKRKTPSVTGAAGQHDNLQILTHFHGRVGQFVSIPYRAY